MYLSLEKQPFVLELQLGNADGSESDRIIDFA